MSHSSSPEILAPAGNWDCVRAAVANGAHAVYFGLDQFNARMRADNFSRADLPVLMPYLHGHGVRGYVTMNVLIFPAEFVEALEYLDALDAAGVDGVIVQDMGLASIVSRYRREGRWQLELHLSTQMTITCPEAVRLVDELFDPQQIVLARELSLREIEACARATTKPIEVFCHGALCVAYSGQCLTSESLGQRSANRGECAQACRMPYRLEVDGRMRELGERRYLFSPQDLCALDRVPQMLAAGVHSFKIEGRLKSPEYVAATTRAYRRALDAALAEQGADKTFARHRAADIYAMQMAFSRGFSTGWLDGTDHPLLTHGRFGKKRGALAGRIAAWGEGWVELEGELAIPVSPGDGFVIDAGQDRNEEQGGRIWRVEGRKLFFHGKGSRIDWRYVRRGDLLWKTADPALDKRLHASWSGFDRPAPVPVAGVLDIHVEGRIGSQLTATCRGITVGSGQPLEPAEKRPLTPETIEAQFGRLGGTGYALGTCTCALEGGLMLPLSVLNRMRRELVEKLDASPQTAAAAQTRPAPDWAPPSFPPLPEKKGYTLSVLCRSVEQAEAAARAGIKRIYLDFKDIRSYRDAVEKLRGIAPECKVWLATLRIMKPHEGGFFKYIHEAAPDGVLVRNLGAALHFREKGVPMVGDFSLNAANAESVRLWRALGMRAVTLSYDLNAAQLGDLLASGCGPLLELTLHQHMPMFHTEHCVFCTFLSQGHNFKDCGQPCEHHRVRVMDRKRAMHYLVSDEGCRNTLFNGQAQTAARVVQEARRQGLRRFRIELLAENAEKSTAIIEGYRELLKGQCSASELMERLDLLDRIGVTAL